MQITNNSPDKYLQSLPDGVREDMITLDREMAKIMAGYERVLWEGVFWGGSQQKIIGYGKIVYTNSKKQPVEWFPVGLAQQKDYISVYVSAVQGNAYVTDQLKGRLGKAKVGKSNVSFKRLADIELGVLLQMVQIAKESMT